MGAGNQHTGTYEDSDPTFCSASWDLDVTTTWAPISARRYAICSPMPMLEPVTITLFPWSIAEKCPKPVRSLPSTPSLPPATRIIISVPEATGPETLATLWHLPREQPDH